jgi:diguanylate cyclase (GGDEF)-like protein
MGADVAKHLDRAKRFLEKNKIEEAIQAYLAVLEEAPAHQEATQALGDLYARSDQPERAAIYYGALFDLLVDPRDDTKALAIYNRFLRPSPVRQSPERVARYALLLQKQNRIDEAIEQYTAAAEDFLSSGRDEDALTCWERVAQIDPGNPSRHIRVAETAERVGKHEAAARSFLRAGQIAAASDAPGDALRLLGRAYQLAPQDRSVALLYAGAQLSAGDPAEAVRILDPFAPAETDALFFETYGEALMRAGELDRARASLERSTSLQATFSSSPFFELADYYAKAGQERVAVEILTAVKARMFALKRQNEFADELDHIGEANPSSLLIAEFWAFTYNELNREARYFETLLHLFDLYSAGGNMPKACECLERLMEIDPYDHRNQERLERLRGRVDEAYLKSLGGRLAKSPISAAPAAALSEFAEGAAASAAGEEGRARQALEDLIVQTEIFLQYSLNSKAVERLQRIAAMFPGEEERNVRLRALYEAANWRPPGSVSKPEELSTPMVAARPVPSTGRTGVYSADTLRDLTQISEINRKVYRQPSPRAMLKTTVNEVGTYLGASRCLAVIGSRGRPHEMAAEYCAPGVKPAAGAQVVYLLSEMEKAKPDDLGGLPIEATEGSVLRDMGLQSALGVVIPDKETQQPAGMLIVAHVEPHRWKPNETYFLQAIGDQMLLSVSHTRLRSLVRRMGVSDERTGVLSRSSYLDCLLNEADRARTQGSPLGLAILQLDRGPELLRLQGEPALDRYLDQLARTLYAVIRQSDIAVKYMAWSLAFALPDTPLAGASILADKLRKAARGVRPPWDGTAVTFSVGIVEAVVRADYDNEDIVTDLINRAEISLEEARKRGGDVVVALESPKP